MLVWGMAAKGKETVRAVPSYGVQPLGNRFLSEEAERSHAICRQGLGPLNVMNDDQLVELFKHPAFSVADLCALTQVSQALYVICHQEEIWREHCFRLHGGAFHFQGTWKRTVRYHHLLTTGKVNAYVEEVPLRTRGFFSDSLYQAWHCSTVDMRKWCKVENIDRRSGLTFEQFMEEYEIPNKPVIFTDIVTSWPAFANGNWEKAALVRRNGETKLQCGGVTMRLKDYFRYSEQAQEEIPMYLFDNLFIEKMEEFATDYEVPAYFTRDYFALLDRKESTIDAEGNPISGASVDGCDGGGPGLRPSNRWFLVGPPRSGSTFHKDPNYTSAWNGLTTGLKKWVMYPPELTPPGVIPSEDHANVTTPISVLEWFVQYYDANPADCPRSKRLECCLRPGELLFIPHMWWHAALNIEESIAVTQNFVADSNLLNVVDFLKHQKKEHMLVALKEKLRTKNQEVLQRIEEHERRSEKEKSNIQAGSAKSSDGSAFTKSSWESMAGDSTAGGSFSFGFSFNDE